MVVNDLGTAADGSGASEEPALAVVKEIDYEAYLDKAYPGMGTERMENCRSLISAAAEYAEETGDESLEGFLDRSALVSLFRYDARRDMLRERITPSGDHVGRGHGERPGTVDPECDRRQDDARHQQLAGRGNCCGRRARRRRHERGGPRADRGGTGI